MSLPRYIVNLEELSDEIIGSFVTQIGADNNLIKEKLWRIGYDIRTLGDEKTIFILPIEGEYSFHHIDYSVDKQGEILDKWSLYKGEELFFSDVHVAKESSSKSFPTGVYSEEEQIKIEIQNNQGEDNIFHISFIIKGEPEFPKIKIQCCDVDTAKVFREIEKDILNKVDRLIFYAPVIPNYYNVGLLQKGIEDSVIDEETEEIIVKFWYQRKC